MRRQWIEKDRLRAIKLLYTVECKVLFISCLVCSSLHSCYLSPQLITQTKHLSACGWSENIQLKTVSRTGSGESVLDWNQSGTGFRPTSNPVTERLDKACLQFSFFFTSTWFSLNVCLCSGSNTNNFRFYLQKPNPSQTKHSALTARL